eukprot:Filipodium_phascolosomae@DN1358_c0_g1_i1.p1
MEDAYPREVPNAFTMPSGQPYDPASLGGGQPGNMSDADGGAWGAGVGDGSGGPVNGTQKVIQLDGCNPLELKAMAKDMASSTVTMDVDFHRRLDQLMRFYEDTIKVLEEASKQNQDAESKVESQLFDSIRPTLQRRLDHLGRVRDVLDDVAIPQSVPCTAKERAISMKGRAMCNARHVDTQYNISKNFSQVATSIQSAGATVTSWMNRRPPGGSSLN